MIPDSNIREYVEAWVRFWFSKEGIDPKSNKSEDWIKALGAMHDHMYNYLTYLDGKASGLSGVISVVLSLFGILFAAADVLREFKFGGVVVIGNWDVIVMALVVVCNCAALVFCCSIFYPKWSTTNDLNRGRIVVETDRVPDPPNIIVELIKRRNQRTRRLLIAHILLYFSLGVFVLWSLARVLSSQVG